MEDLYRNLLVNSYPTHTQTIVQVSGWDSAHQEMFLRQMQVLLDAANSTREITPANAVDINAEFVEAYSEALARNRDLNIERYNALAENAQNAQQLLDAYNHTKMLVNAAQQSLAESKESRYGQKLDEFRQKKAGVKQYIWASMGDDKVRASHAALDGQLRDWTDSPAPGEESGCRCSAVPASFFGADASGIAEPVYPELLLPIFRALGLVRNLFMNNPKPSNEITKRNREVAEKIANGHAYDKHVVKARDFPKIKNRKQFQELIEDVMNNPDEVRELENGRKVYWRDKEGIAVFDNPSDPDGGSAYIPKKGKGYFDTRKSREGYAI
jgi:SPP1 gp7 family putative phage head morphogenesis protein